MTTPSQRRDVLMEFAVGAFMFLVLVVISYLTIMLSSQSIFRKTYPLDVHFSDVTGIRKGDNIVSRGMNIGKIKEMTFTDDGVLMSCSLEQPVQLREDYKIQIVPTSILGGHALDIARGSSKAAPLPEGAVVRGVDPNDLVGEASVAMHEIRKSLTEGKVLENLEKTMAELRAVADRIGRGEGFVGKLLTDDSLYTNLQAMVTDARGAVSELKTVAERLERGEGTLGKLLVDDSVYTNLQAISINVREVSDRLAAGKGTLGKLLSEDDRLYQDLTGTVASLKIISEGLERGEGTLGKIMRKDDLYVDVKDTIEQVRGAVDDFRETTPLISVINLLMGAF